MSNPFFDHPILNSPYTVPVKHWELDESGQPTQKILDFRRPASFITPIPKPKKRTAQQGTLLEDATAMALSTKEQEYELATRINELRSTITAWRNLPDIKSWKVTPETARLLQHWRHHDFSGIRPFFCQLEAVETAIWLTEVAPKDGKRGEKFLEYLQNANNDANPGLPRLALKLATGAGKTTVMAMLIAWQTINAVRYPNSKRFSNGFLVVTPGITIRDRLRVLLPTDAESYYQSRELVPPDMLRDIQRARVVITNYHAFKLREKTELSGAGRALLTGRHGDALNTLEPEGQMLQRVMGELMGMKNIIVFNDEAHHCYQERPESIKEEITVREGEEKKEASSEAKANNEAARLWINGLKTVQKKLEISRIFDLSATPFFLRGSGYAEGTLFPWTVCDFSLMDAIECGVVKLPRVPVADNIPSGEMPKFRDLWKNIRKDMPRAGRGKNQTLDPQKLPTLLQNALDALYGHYKDTYAAWQTERMDVAPCFIIVCNNTATSKLIYDYVSGYVDTAGQFHNGRFELFRNFDENGNALSHSRTLLIDSEQLESGEKLPDDFRKTYAEAIERFRREALERGGALADDLRRGKEIDDSVLLREVMNTVGKPNTLGGDIRCVVSVSMLTEGWDANTVTHVLGVRAFGTQLLCEQVIGRALRRQSYDLNEENLFNTEYADVMGIPFDFTAQAVKVPPVKPRPTVHVKAVRPERDRLEITFPRVVGYRVELPREHIRAQFTEDSRLTLDPDLVGPTEALMAGIVGETATVRVEDRKDMRPSTIIAHLTSHYLRTKQMDDDGNPRLYLFGQIKKIIQQWLREGYLECLGGTYPAMLLDRRLADMACEKIHAAVNRAGVQDAGGKPPVLALLDPYNPTGSTRYVNFTTSKTDRWQTSADKCHVNWCILDSDWEGAFCYAAEQNPRVLAYAKNHNLGFEVPYSWQGQEHMYRPDFLLLVDDGHGPEDPLHLVVEIKGWRDEQDKAKKEAMEVFWIPGVNNLKSLGRWAFAELKRVYALEGDMEIKIKEALNLMLDAAASIPSEAQSGI